MFIKDPKTKEPSVTVTAFCLGFVVATVKLLFSGVVVAGVTLAPFSGSDFAAVVGALGSVYVARKYTDTP